jgi:hypothetical protein
VQWLALSKAANRAFEDKSEFPKLSKPSAAEKGRLKAERALRRGASVSQLSAEGVRQRTDVKRDSSNFSITQIKVMPL